MNRIIESLFLAILFAASLGLNARSQIAYDRFVPICWGVFGTCGYFDRREVAVAIPNTFERTMRFSEGMAAVRVAGGLYGFIDDDGEMVIEPQFDLAGAFHRGLAEVLIDGKTGVINRAGEIVVTPQFKRSIPFTNKVLFVAEGDWKRNRIQGAEVLDDMLTAYVYPNVWGLYHIEDGWIMRPQYRLKPLGVSDLIVVSDDRRYSTIGLLRPDGSWEVPPDQFDPENAREAYPVPRKEYYYPYDREAVQAAVEALRGPRIRPGSVPEVRHASILNCRGGARLVSQNGLWGIVGPDESVILDTKFRAIDCFDQGVAWVPVDDKRQWCAVGPDGDLRDRPGCRQTYYPVNWSHHYPERLADDPFESSVLWVRALLAHGNDRNAPPPYLVGDGVQGHGRQPVTEVFR